MRRPNERIYSACTFSVFLFPSPFLFFPFLPFFPFSLPFPRRTFDARGRNLRLCAALSARSFRKSGKVLSPFYSESVITVLGAVSRAAASIIFLYCYCDRYHCLVDRILFEYGYGPSVHRGISNLPYALSRSLPRQDCITTLSCLSVSLSLSLSSIPLSSISGLSRVLSTDTEFLRRSMKSRYYIIRVRVSRGE